MARSVLCTGVLEVGVDVPRKTVLVVDDEEPFLLSLVDALAPHAARFGVMTALSGAQALELVQRTHVDLVITDLKMPGMSGFELVRRLAQHYPHLPVIVMTAFDSPEIESELAAFAPVAVLDKPLDLDELVVVVTRALATATNATGAAHLTIALVALLILTMATVPGAVPLGALAGRTDSTMASTGAGPDGQDWRIAVCSDPRA